MAYLEGINASFALNRLQRCYKLFW